MEVLGGMVRAFGIALAPETPYPLPRLPRLVRLALRLLYGLADCGGWCGRGRDGCVCSALRCEELVRRVGAAHALTKRSRALRPPYDLVLRSG